MTDMGDRATFVPEGFIPPDALDTPSFRLTPLGPEHNASDYAAWTGSRDHIRRTPGFTDGDRPGPMTIEENRGDLVRHANDFAARKGFTYTVLAPTADEVIGCVFIYPERDSGGAFVSSWVREQNAGLDGPLYRAVADWLARDRPFEHVGYDARLPEPSSDA